MTENKPSAGAVAACEAIEPGIMYDLHEPPTLPDDAAEIIDREAVAPAVAELIAALELFVPVIGPHASDMESPIRHAIIYSEAGERCTLHRDFFEEARALLAKYGGPDA